MAAGAPSVGIKAKNGVVIAVEKKQKSFLYDESSITKVSGWFGKGFLYDNVIWVANVSIIDIIIWAHVMYLLIINYCMVSIHNVYDYRLQIITNKHLDNGGEVYKWTPYFCVGI